MNDPKNSGTSPFIGKSAALLASGIIGTSAGKKVSEYVIDSLEIDNSTFADATEIGCEAIGVAITGRAILNLSKKDPDKTVVTAMKAIAGLGAVTQIATAALQHHNHETISASHAPITSSSDALTTDSLLAHDTDAATKHLLYTHHETAVYHSSAELGAALESSRFQTSDSHHTDYAEAESTNDIWGNNHGNDIYGKPPSDIYGNPASRTIYGAPIVNPEELYDADDL